MNRKIKDALTLGIAAAFVLMFALWSICKSDDAVSESERRPLKQFPTLNVEEVLSGRFQSNFESYMLDQFPLRDELRTLKALSVRDLFGEKDNNGIYVADGYAAKLDDTIHEDSLDHAADRFRYVYETYLKDTGANVYLSVIPDKNYFLAAENGYPAMDYEKFFALMRQKVDFADYIDLTGTLSLSSYYRTDLHWRQEMLAPTAKALADAMGVSLTVDFTEVTLDTPFYGVYRGSRHCQWSPTGSPTSQTISLVAAACTTMKAAPISLSTRSKRQTAATRMKFSSRDPSRCCALRTRTRRRSAGSLSSAIRLPRVYFRCSRRDTARSRLPTSATSPPQCSENSSTLPRRTCCFFTVRAF